MHDYFCLLFDTHDNMKKEDHRKFVLLPKYLFSKTKNWLDLEIYTLELLPDIMQKIRIVKWGALKGI